MTPGDCVPHTNCCVEEGDEDGDEGDAGGEGEGDAGGEGVTWLYAASIPPAATMTAATPVRIPGKDVQNDFLLSSPIANFTISYSDNKSYQNG
jgi:hypothetical protein